MKCDRGMGRVPSAQHLTISRSGISENGHGALMIHSAQHLMRQPGRGSQRRRGMSGSDRVAALVPWSLCSATVSAMALLLGALCSAE